MAKPVIKWVGGKTQLLGALKDALPDEIEGTYYEAFIGGGALFFDLASRGLIHKAVLNDWNLELVNLYQCLKFQPEALYEALTLIQAQGGLTGFTEEDYYAMRAISPTSLPVIEMAVRTIYLNKCGFNGLFRTNKKGIFNVPWGKRTKVTLFDPDNIRSCAAAMDTVVKVTKGDFAKAVEAAVKGDAAYFDPPYVPHSVTSNFTAYTSEGFGLEDQKRLVTTMLDLMARGVHCVASNNDTPVVRELYSDPRFELRAVPARRNINAKGDGRGPVGELIIVGRPLI